MNNVSQLNMLHVFLSSNKHLKKQMAEQSHLMSRGGPFSSHSVADVQNSIRVTVKVEFHS